MNPGQRSTDGDSRTPSSGRRAVQFGPFELDLNTGELRKNGIRLKLQGKSFHILEALLERRGEVVTREELKARLWPGDTFVDFESGLNTAANRLRLALGDSADNPRFIETVARSGYRFIGTVIEIAPPQVIELPAPEPQPTPILVEPPPRASERPPRRLNLPVYAGIATLLAIAGLFWLAANRGTTQPVFRKITFRRGSVGSARFAPDGQTILYSAAWDGDERRLFLASTVSPESRELEYKNVTLAGISSSAELALLYKEAPFSSPQLMRVPLNGGAPVTIAKGVTDATWAPDGKTLAICRYNARESVIEFPPGKQIYRTTVGISDLRISPDGASIAFIEHAVPRDDAGSVKVIEHGGPARTLTPNWASAGGLAWSPNGKEIWFTAGAVGVRRAVYAVTPVGKLRTIANLPEMLTLFDISRDGKVLIGIDNSRMMAAGSFGGQQGERDLSWFDWTHATSISQDANFVLLDETGDGGGVNSSVYLRTSKTNSAAHLGEGQALALSPDAKWALAFNCRTPSILSLLPIGPESPRTVSGQGIEYRFAQFFPDGQKILVSGSYPGKPVRLFVQSLNGGKPIPLEPEVFLGNAMVSPDGKQIAGIDQDRRIALMPVSGGKPLALDLPFPANPVEWSTDGRALFVRDLRTFHAARIMRYDLGSMQAQPWKDLAPQDRVGLEYVMDVIVGADGKSYAYSYLRKLSELFVVDGWK